MKLGCVFPGQGSQVVGMGQDLYDNFSLARELYDQASSVLGFDLLQACENRNNELNDTNVVQPAILVHSVICWHLIQQMMETPAPVAAMTGHSLGELSAVVCAGGLEFTKAVSLVKQRAALMAACAEDGGMMVVFGLPEEPVTHVCAEISSPTNYVAVANRNAAEQWVLSGHRKALHAAAVCLEEMGGVVKQLNISIPAHSILMAPVLPAFAEAIRQANPQDCTVPVISCIAGTTYRKAEELAPMLSSQLTRSVNWPLTVTKLIEKGVDTMIELGPKTILRDLIRLEFPDVCAVSFGTADSRTAVQRLLEAKGRRKHVLPAAVPRSQVEEFLQACLRLAVGTPSLKELSPARFKQAIQEPYQALIENVDALRATDARQTDPEVLRRAVRCILDLLRAKGLTSQQCLFLLQEVTTHNTVQDAIVEYLV